MKIVIFVLLTLSSFFAHAQKMTGAEAGLRLERFLGQEELYNANKGNVAYQINGEYILDIWNLRLDPDAGNVPSFSIRFKKNGEWNAVRFGLNYWKGSTGEIVEVTEEPLKITIVTSYNSLILEKREEGDLNSTLKSVSVVYPNGAKFEYQDDRRIPPPGYCYGSITPYTVHNRNGVPISLGSYRAPPPAPGFWSSVLGKR